MQLVDHDTFLRQLAALFESSRETGSVWITHKRLTHDGEDASMSHVDAGSDDKHEYPCIVKVTDGDKTNFSTRVTSSELPRFYSAYGTLLKSAMTLSLRKRDKKREKVHSEQAAKRKKRMTEPVKIDGPKRGNGRRKRQRQIKAAVKQVESMNKFKEREAARKKQ